jgi:hypothetical protein
MRNWVTGGRRKSGLWKRMKFERREKRGRESENEKREKESGEMILCARVRELRYANR